MAGEAKKERPKIRTISLYLQQGVVFIRHIYFNAHKSPLLGGAFLFAPTVKISLTLQKCTFFHFLFGVVKNIS